MTYKATVEAITMAQDGGNNPLAVEAINKVLYAALTENKKKPDTNKSGISDIMPLQVKKK